MPHCMSKGSSAPGGPAKARWISKKKKFEVWVFCSMSAKEKGGGKPKPCSKAAALLHCLLGSWCCTCSPPLRHTNCRRDFTCTLSLFRLPLSLPFLLARCLLRVDNKQQIDRYCTGICLKVHGTHQSMARVPVFLRSCCCCELPCLFSALGKASALSPKLQHWRAGPANCTMSALPKLTLMKRLQVTFERKSQEGSIS